MDVEACNAILGRHDLGEMLREASDQRLFISSVGDETPSFRYHQLFRDFLLDRLRTRAPERLQQLQQRAAHWYESQGWPEAAVTFYVAAGETEQAAAVAEANAQRLLAAGRHETLLNWAQQLSAYSDETPGLLFQQAKAYADGGNLPAANAALAAAEQAYRKRQDKAGLLDVELYHSLLAYRAGQYSTALEAAQRGQREAAALNVPAMGAVADRYAGMAYLALGDLNPATVAHRTGAGALRKGRAAR